jgi:hypothetical protein
MDSNNNSENEYRHLFVPVAKDGSWFGPHLARSGGRYSVGEKGEEYQVMGFATALNVLARMPVAKWRRPNKNHNWGIVAAVGKWRRLGDLMKENNQSLAATKLNHPATVEKPLEETEIGSIYEFIKDNYAARTLSSAVENEKLNKLVTKIVESVSSASEAEKLCAASALGYLSFSPSVKNREEVVFSPMESLFTKAPPPLSTLNIETSDQNSDRRRRAAVALAHSKAEWLVDYCAESAILEESNSDLPREQLINNVLSQLGNLTDLFDTLKSKALLFKEIEDIEQRFTRVKRFFESVVKVINEWTGPCGESPGESLADLFSVTHRGVSEKVESGTRYDIADSAQNILNRIIELRFSYAMTAETYAVIFAIKRTMDTARWVSYLKAPKAIELTRINLLEAMLVLARQGREDATFANLIVDVFGHRATAKSAITNQLKHYLDIDPEIRGWWEKVGRVSVSRGKREQRNDVTVDHQVGALLIETEDAKEAMEKMGRAVVPQLKLSNPLLAATTSKASKGYGEIARIARQLGRVCKLNVTNNKGDIVEYNRRLHEMLGGHQPGVRKVRVLRNGVEKEFGGEFKTIIKEWVEPAD